MSDKVWASLLKTIPIYTQPTCNETIQNMIKQLTLFQINAIKSAFKTSHLEQIKMSEICNLLVKIHPK